MGVSTYPVCRLGTSVLQWGHHYNRGSDTGLVWEHTRQSAVYLVMQGG